MMYCTNCDGEGIIPRQEHFGSDTFCHVCNGSGDSDNPDQPQRYVAGFVDLDLPDEDY